MIFWIARTRRACPAKAGRHLLFHARPKLLAKSGGRVRCAPPLFYAAPAKCQFPNWPPPAPRFPTQNHNRIVLSKGDAMRKNP
jgi:hypothetical protein